MFNNEWKALEEKAIQAGISRELAALIYNVARDADGHGWSKDLKDWIEDEEELVSLALEKPEAMDAVCSYHLAGDGGNYEAGLQYLDVRRLAIAQHVISNGWAVPLPDDLPDPPLPQSSRTAPATEAEIIAEMEQAVLVKYPEMNVDLEAFAIHSGEQGIRRFYASVTVNDPKLMTHTGQNISDGFVTGNESSNFDFLDFEYYSRWDRAKWENDMGYLAKQADAETSKPKEMASAIKTLQAAARHQTGAGAFCKNFLAACFGKVEIDLSDIARLDSDNAAAAVTVFSGLANQCGETRNLIEELDD